MSVRPANRIASLSAERIILFEQAVDQFEQAVDQFEQAWFGGQRPRIEAFLTDDGELRPVVLAELVRIDREFRAKAGEPTPLQDYVERFLELADDESLIHSLNANIGQAFQPDRGAAPVAGRDASDAGVNPHTSRAGKPDLPGKQLIASRLVTESQLRECFAVVAKDGRVTASDLTDELLRRGLVTSWQLDHLRRGRTAFFIDQNRYVLLSQIGQGGMGTVYKARHVRMGRDVALKVIDPKRLTDKTLIDRFRREVEVCSKLQHEHIVQAFDVGEYAGALFLVLEFVEGADLASLVKRDGPMQPAEAAAIIMQAAAGLAFAHAHGIVHRDVKPQNILLSTSGIVKILDLGLARVLDDPASDDHTSLTQEGTMMGTVDYMSPEQAKDSRLADGRSDVYSLGATLYYLLAGKPPFAGGAPIEKLHRLANASPPPLSQFRIDCPPELEVILQKMLAKRPEDRFQGTVDVIRSLRPLAAERIAGRPAVTAAVQSAAETLDGAFATETAAPMNSFIPVDDSFATTKHRLQTQRGSPRRFATGAVIVTALLAMVAIWGFPAKGKKTELIGDEKVPLQNSSTRLPPERIVRELFGHFGGPMSLAWSPDAVHLAVGSLDGEIHIRVMGFVEPITRYDKHRSSVVGVIWLPKGNLVASTEAAGDIHIWHAFSGETLHMVKRNRIDYYGSNVGSNGGMGMACSADGDELCYSNGNSIVRLSIPAFEPLGSLPLEGQVWHDFRYSPSGKMLATSWSSSSGEGGIAVNRLSTGNSVLRIKGIPATDGWHGAEFLLGAFSSEDELAVVRPKRLEVWNVSAGDVVREFPIDTGTLSAAYDWVPMAGFPAKAAHFALWTKDELRLISTRDGATRRVASPIPRGTAGRKWDFTSDMQQVAVFGHYAPGLEIIRLADGRRECPWGDGLFGMVSIAGLPRLHGDVLVQCSSGQSWDLRTGELRYDLAGKSFTVSPTGNLWILEDNRLRTLANEVGNTDEIGPPIVIEGAAPLNPYTDFWSGDRRRLFQMRGKTLHVWESETGRKIASFRLEVHEYFVEPSYDGKTVGLVVSGTSALLAEPYDQPPEIFPAVPVASRFSLSVGNEYLAGPGVIHRTTDRKTFTAENRALTFGWNGSFSRTGEYLLADHCIWRLSGKVPEKVWTCPEETRAVHSLPNVPSFFANCWFDDEEHVLLTHDASIGVWRWRENRKRATLYFLPDENWAFVNHETQHWNGTPGADRYLRYERRDGDKTLRSKPADDRKQFGWKNDPEKAGLDLPVPATSAVGKTTKAN